MNSLLRNTVLLLCAWLLLAGVCMAKEVHLKDGSIIDCESVWRRGDKVVVKINRDTMLEFSQDQIDLGRTFPKARVKPRHTRKKKSAAVVRKHRVAKSSAQVAPVPVQAAPKAAAPMPAAKPLPAAKPGTSAAPVPSTVPQPAANEPVQPRQEQASSAGTVSPPGTAGQDQQARQAAEMMANAIQSKDPELLKKAIEAQQGAIPLGVGPAAGASLTVLLLVAGLVLLVIVSMWVVFTKAGEAGWKSLIPIYNMYVLLLISGKPGWWLLLLFIPLIGSIFHLLAMLSLAERFGRGALFGIGLFFLPMFFFPLLAFGRSQYEG